MILLTQQAWSSRSRWSLCQSPDCLCHRCPRTRKWAPDHKMPANVSIVSDTSVSKDCKLNHMVYKVLWAYMTKQQVRNFLCWNLAYAEMLWKENTVGSLKSPAMLLPYWKQDRECRDTSLQNRCKETRKRPLSTSTDFTTSTNHLSTRVGTKLKAEETQH